MLTQYNKTCKIYLKHWMSGVNLGIEIAVSVFITSTGSSSST